MPKISNKYGLPDALVRFLERDPYTRGASRISATQLLSPPRLVQLLARYDQDIVVDVSDQLFLLWGKALHHVLDHGTGNQDGTTSEERLFSEIEGWRVSGQIDLQTKPDGLVLSDWKMTSVWSVMREKIEWEQQLNIYAWLSRQNGREPSRLQVVALLRDWNKREYERKAAEGYPPAAMHVVQVKMWPQQAAEDYVRDRVKRHQLAAIEYDMGVEPPECTDEERWLRPGKKGEPGKPTRCLEYCRVSAWCQQHKRWLDAQKEGHG